MLIIIIIIVEVVVKYNCTLCVCVWEMGVLLVPEFINFKGNLSCTTGRANRMPRPGTNPAPSPRTHCTACALVPCDFTSSCSCSLTYDITLCLWSNASTQLRYNMASNYAASALEPDFSPTFIWSQYGPICTCHRLMCSLDIFSPHRSLHGYLSHSDVKLLIASTYGVPKPALPMFKCGLESDFSLLKMVQDNLLNSRQHRSEQYKYLFLLSHLKLPRARRLTMAYMYHPHPYTTALLAPQDTYG